MTLSIAAIMKPEISIQTVLPPYEKILLTPIFYLVYRDGSTGCVSVEVYLHPSTKVRHYRLHILDADAKRPWRDRCRIVGQLGTGRREYLGSSVESNSCVGKIRDRSLPARNCRGARVRRFGRSSFRSELNRHLPQQRPFASQVHPRAVDCNIQVQLLVEQRLPFGELDRDPQFVLLGLHDRIRTLSL